MFQESFSGLDKDVHLHFERGHADVHLIGVDETYLRVLGEGEASDYNAQWQSGTLTMNLDEDCRFFIPRNLNVHVSGELGDLRVSAQLTDVLCVPLHRVRSPGFLLVVVFLAKRRAVFKPRLECVAGCATMQMPTNKGDRHGYSDSGGWVDSRQRPKRSG